MDKLVQLGASLTIITVGQICKVDRAILQICATENTVELPPTRARVLNLIFLTEKIGMVQNSVNHPYLQFDQIIERGWGRI